MRVLLIGVVGFIGLCVDVVLWVVGYDVVGVDVLLFVVYRLNLVLLLGCQWVDVCDVSVLVLLLVGVDLVCYQVVMVGVGVNVVDVFVYGGYNDFVIMVLLVQMFVVGVCCLVLVLLMVVYGQGCYDCFQYGLVDLLLWW